MRNKSQSAVGRCWWRAACQLTVASIVSFAAAEVAHTQTFDVGSDGSDGALNVPAGQGEILFDPADIARWGRVLDPDGDGVYHFTTITIGNGTTLKFRGDKVNKPVYFLASGAIVLNGVIDLDGETGAAPLQLIFRRTVARPGSGGFGGGAGGYANVPATPGDGPGGGSGGVTSGNSCSVQSICGRGATFTGNRYLVPLAGGSGGEGATWNSGHYHGGGAGGGAILLASSVSIAANAEIQAIGGGGSSGVGGAGGGGTIRLVAPVLSGSGQFHVSGGGANSAASSGAPGWIRLEGFSISTSFRFSPNGSVVTRGAPVDLSTLRAPNSLRVTAIAGVAVPVYPSGSFVLPDVAINSAGPVNVDIEANGIPPGTVVTLRVMPDTPEDPVIINLPEVTLTLQGTLQHSTATVPFTFPYGFSTGYVRATWAQ